MKFYIKSTNSHALQGATLKIDGYHRGETSYKKTQTHAHL